MAAILHDRFKVIRTLGEGAQGRASLAEDVGSGARVVLKELLLGKASDWKAVELFERESAILRALNHPAIPAYIDAFHLDEGARLFLVQEYIEGDNLEALLEAGELFGEEALRDFLRQMLDILDYLQRFSPPVVHRDIKPSNILRDAQGNYYLVDFGGVQLIVQDRVGGSTVVGTNGFMPPEQVIGRATPASDIYALGATCVHLLSRRHPDELPVVRMALQFQNFINASPHFVRMLEKMLAMHVEDRFQGAGEVIEFLDAPRELAGALRGRPRSVTPPRALKTQRLVDSAVAERLENPNKDSLHLATPIADATNFIIGLFVPVMFFGGGGLMTWEAYISGTGSVEGELLGPIILAITGCLILYLIASKTKRSILDIKGDQLKLRTKNCFMTLENRVLTIVPGMRAECHSVSTGTVNDKPVYKHHIVIKGLRKPLRVGENGERQEVNYLCQQLNNYFSKYDWDFKHPVQ